VWYRAQTRMASVMRWVVTTLPIFGLVCSLSVSNTAFYQSIVKPHVAQLARRQVGDISADEEPAWDGNYWCIPQTGRRCFNGPSDCAPYVQCTETFYCVCHDWGCSDATGVCRPVHNKFAQPDIRIAPASWPNYFLTMPADGETKPSVIKGYPKDENAEAHWSFLMLPDNATVLITTKMNRYQTDPIHTAFGAYLDMPSPPWNGSLLAPIQARPKNVLEAAWRIVQKPQSRVALMHVWSERYLSFDEETGQLSSCVAKNCDTKSIEFNFWPNIEGNLEWPIAPKWVPQERVKSAEPVFDKSDKTFDERDANTTKQTQGNYSSHENYKKNVTEQ